MKKTFAVLVLFVGGAVSLSACDLMGASDGDCQINSDYEIRCDGGGGEPGLQAP